MSAAIVLDATPLGILCHSRNSPHVVACRQWLDDVLAAGRRVILPEIADYQVRRELVRFNTRVALSNLDQLGSRLEYSALTTATMRLAAELWAQARSTGQPTAPDSALDADVIVAAQLDFCPFWGPIVEKSKKNRGLPTFATRAFAWNVAKSLRRIATILLAAPGDDETFGVRRGRRFLFGSEQCRQKASDRENGRMSRHVNSYSLETFRSIR